MTLQRQGYIKEARVRSTRAGFETTEYGLTTKTHLALMFDSIELEDLLDPANVDTALGILAAIAFLAYTFDERLTGDFYNLSWFSCNPGIASLVSFVLELTASKRALAHKLAHETFFPWFSVRL